MGDDHGPVVKKTLFAEQAAAQFRRNSDALFREISQTRRGDRGASEKAQLSEIDVAPQATTHSAALCPSNATDVELFVCPAIDVLDEPLATFNASRTKLQRIARENG